MKYEISGMVQEAEGERGVPGVIVSAFDKDRLFDDLLGEVMSDAAGAFHITYDEEKFKSLFDKAPDIYLTVKSASGKVLYTTEGATRFNATPHEQFQLKVSAKVLHAAGLQAVDSPIKPASQETLTTLTCLENADVNDDLVKQIKADIAGKSSILEMMKGYMADLKGDLDNDALPLRKLAKLFELGSVPEGLEGHYYGIVPGLRTGDLPDSVAEYANLLGYVWGAAVEEVCLWVGKSFTPMSDGDRRQVIRDAVPEDLTIYRGINHFNTIEHAPVNIALNSLLTFMWHLEDTPDAERLRYGHERNGGHFAFYRAHSIYEKTPREVFRLNYRFSGLGNFPPLVYLIDELVEIGDGIYLGQVLFATSHFFEQYDPEAENEVYKYQHFGYFLLFREDWNTEARRLFPHLEMPAAAQVASATILLEPQPIVQDKFTTLTLADPVNGDVDPGTLDEIRQDLADSGSIIKMLKSYSEELGEELDTTSPTFGKLHTLFNAGIGPKTMDGFYYGALVSWKARGLLEAFNFNTLNAGWQAIKTFSPWTGKRFDPVDKERLLELTDNYEKMDIPTFFCANTVVFRTARERIAGRLMRLADLWIEDATQEERRLHGYDAKTFFYIGKYARSVLPANKGKMTFQFNYRWKKLRNPIPDCYCIDELVQIADGLYLGQVFYATDLLEPWDPEKDPSVYKYELYEYFIVMDEEWQARRIHIGYDLENI